MTYRELWSRLTRMYDEGEAKAVARMVYEVGYGLTMSDLLMGRDSEVPGWSARNLCSTSWDRLTSSVVPTTWSLAF